jgi:hypothetical protein
MKSNAVEENRRYYFYLKRVFSCLNVQRLLYMEGMGSRQNHLRSHYHKPILEILSRIHHVT